jgi:hypothetical protein
MWRRLGITAMVGALVLGVGGCGDEDADRAKVEAADEDFVAAVDGVLHDVAGRVGLEFKGGDRHYVICGESYAPGGVIINGFVRFGPPRGLLQAEATDAVIEVLEGDGWEVERPPNPDMLLGAKGDVRLTFDMRGVQVHVKTECIETSGDVARAYQDKDVDLEWK